MQRPAALVPSAFEQWAATHRYDLAPAVSTTSTRIYADRRTQEAYDTWTAGAHHVARMITEFTLETDALRKRIRTLSGAGDA